MWAMVDLGVHYLDIYAGGLKGYGVCIYMHVVLCVLGFCLINVKLECLVCLVCLMYVCFDYLQRIL